MWYYANTYYPGNLPTNAMNELNEMAVFDCFIRPMIRSGNPLGSQPIFERSLTGFDADGLVYANPTELQSYYITYENGDSCNYTNYLPIYDPRCRPYYQQAKNDPNHDSISITDPYLFADQFTVGQTFCAKN